MRKMKNIEHRSFAAILCILVLTAFLVTSAESLSRAKEIPTLKAAAKGLQKVDESRLRITISHLQALGNRMTWEKQWQSAHWIGDRLREYGLEVVIHEYEWNERIWPNVIARIQGSQRPEELIMAIAHLDSISYDRTARAPGADDNGTGVAVLLELARILKKTELEQSLVLAVFSNEERGLAGSKAYVKSLQDRANIKAVINLDVLGYSRPRNPFQISAVSAYRSLRGKARAIYRMGRNFLYGFFYPRQTVIVAGRPANARLGSVVAEALQTGGDIKVRTLVGEDCG
jgi:hypothetical protein